MASNAFHTLTLNQSDIPDCPPGYSFRVEFLDDDIIQNYPWDEYDGNGIIRTARAYGQRPDKAPGELILHSERGEHWIYDIQGTTEKARKDRWGISGQPLEKLTCSLGRAPTLGELTAAAVQADVDYCRGWLTGRYSWCVVSVTLLDAEGEEVETASVCGVEWDSWGSNEYAEKEIPKDLAEECLHSAGLTLAQRRQSWRAALSEAREARAWAYRDVQTVGA